MVLLSRRARRARRLDREAVRAEFYLEPRSDARRRERARRSADALAGAEARSASERRGPPGRITPH